MNNKTTRTKIHLAKTLKNLMITERFDKISITQLCQAADVNRKTFYYHFHSMEELLAYLFEREAIDIIAQFNFPADYNKAINFIMDYLESNQKVIRSASTAINTSILRKFLYTDIYEVIQPVVSELAIEKNLELEPDFEAFMTEFYTEAVSGMLLRWIEHPDHYDRFKIEQYSAMLLNSILAK